MAVKKTIITGDLQVNGKVDALEGANNALLASLRTLVETSIGNTYTTNGDVLALISQLADMASDSKLTPVEKKEVKRVWDGIEAEKSIIETQATNAGILVTDAPYVDYENAYTALYTYLLGAGGVLLDLTTTSDIVGTTFRQKFEDYTTMRANLQSAIQDKQPTYTEVLTGFTSGGGTLTPTAPTALVGTCLFTTAYLQWERQTDLTGVITHNIYRSTTSDGTYSLIATTAGYGYSDQNLTLNTSGGEPIATNYYYRVTRLVNGGSESSVSNTATITANPIPEGNIAAGSITAGKIATGVIQAIIATISGYLTIGTSGAYGGVMSGPGTGTTDGDIRTYLDQDEIKIQEYRSGTWYDLIALEVTGTPGLRESSITAWAYTGVFRRGIRITKNKIAWINGDWTEIGEIKRLGVASNTLVLDGDFRANATIPIENVITINSFANSNPFILEMSNGSLICSYKKTSDGYIYRKLSTDKGATWGSESAIVSSGSFYPRLSQVNNGDIFCTYYKGSDNILYMQKSTNYGLTFSGEQQISLATGAYGTIVQLQNGIFVLVYQRISDSYIVLRTSTDNGVNWSATETVINNSSSNFPELVLSENGTLICGYTLATTKVIRRCTDNGATWGSEILVTNSYVYNWASLVSLANGNLMFGYIGPTSNFLYKLSLDDGLTWSSTATTLITETMSTINLYALSNGNVFVSYTTGSLYYLYCRTLPLYSQLGAGIIESGSNTYGYYRMFSDGSLECWGTSSLVVTTTFNAPAGTYGWSFYYGTASITWPKPFLTGTVPIVTTSGNDITGGGQGAGASLYSLTNTGAGIIGFHYTSVSGIIYGWHAIGRWK